MKRSILIPTMAAFLLAGVSGLQAEVVKGEAAAKAKVEEVQMKEEFKAKQDMAKFKKEATQEAKKMDDTAKVKALETKDKAKAKTKTEAFKKDSIADEKKTLK
jgi:hypothetical protein